MSILGSLYSGVSGLATNGQAMSVIGNNISNTNTVGYKSSRAVFSDLLSSSISGSAGESQLGRGVNMSSIDTIFSQGTFESTESNTDLAIEGDGFFILRAPADTSITYSRAGNFHFDENGNLTNAAGFHVQGYYLDDDGNAIGDVSDIKIDTQTFSPAKATSEVSVFTNLNASTAYLGVPFDPADPVNTSNFTASVQVYDSLGNTHLLTNYFNKLDPATNPLEWEFHTMVDGAELANGTAGSSTELANGSLLFAGDGSLAAPVEVATSPINWADGADSQQVSFAMEVTQYTIASNINSSFQNGYGTGKLVKLDIDSDGNILGNYSNGEPRKLARITMAIFNNANGLTKLGDNRFAASVSSGSPIVGTSGSGVGRIFTNSLEQSNVDLAQEFVRMITFQRGFQANSKIINTTDEMLSELINLKR